MQKLDEKIKKEHIQKLGENMIVQTPIKLIQDFALNEHAFLNKPTSTTGMAQARSGMQFVTTRRAQILSLSDEQATLKTEWLQVVPIYFENMFLKQQKTKKIEDYSRTAYRTLAGCLEEFTKKKADHKFLWIVKGLREIADRHK